MMKPSDFKDFPVWLIICIGVGVIAPLALVVLLVLKSQDQEAISEASVEQDTSISSDVPATDPAPEPPHSARSNGPATVEGRQLVDMGLRPKFDSDGYVIRLECYTLRDFEMELVARLPRLEELSLGMLFEYSDITDRGLKHLENNSSLRSLTVLGPDITNEGLESIATISNLKSLSIGRAITTQFTSDGLRCLASLQQLEYLYIMSGRLTDEGLAHLTQLQSLKKLLIWQATIRSDGFLHLSKLRQLEELHVSGQIAGTAAPGLARLTQLKNLNIAGAKPTNETVKYLGGLNNLETLIVGQPASENIQISDEGIRHLASLNRLRFLALTNTSVSDQGLVYLYGIPDLEYLGLLSTKVTEHGVKRIREKLPDCDVTWVDY